MSSILRSFVVSASICAMTFVACLQAPATAAHISSRSELTMAESIRKAMLDSLPREFSGENDWGDKKEVASGLKFSREDGRLHVDRRKKEVNHGLWTQYKVNLIDPEQHLQVRVENLRRTAPGQLEFVVYLSAHLDGEARIERWRRGIKFMNFKAEAASVVQARVDCEVTLRPAPGAGLGSLVVNPHVKSAQLSLVDVDLHRISKFDGPAANEFGDLMRRTLDKELHNREGEIVQKLNAAIVANADKLQFSSDNLVSASWTKAGDFLSKLGKASAAQSPGAPAPTSPAPTPVSAAPAAPQ
jgi:hypothetical protein